MKNDFDYGELVFIGKDGEEISIGQIYDKTTCEDVEEKINEVMDLVDRNFGRFEVFYFEKDEDDEDMYESRHSHKGRTLKEFYFEDPEDARWELNQGEYECCYCGREVTGAEGYCRNDDDEICCIDCYNERFGKNESRRRRGHTLREATRSKQKRDVFDILDTIQTRFDGDYGWGLALSGFRVEGGADSGKKGTLWVFDERKNKVYKVNVKLTEGKFICTMDKLREEDVVSSSKTEPEVLKSYKTVSTNPQKIVDFVIHEIKPSVKTIDIESLYEDE